MDFYEKIWKTPRFGKIYYKIQKFSYDIREKF